MGAVEASLLALIAAIEASGKEMSAEVHDALSEIHAAYCAPEPEPEPDESMDGDAGSALASAGMGVDEDYGHYENGEERDGEDYEGRMWGND